MRLIRTQKEECVFHLGKREKQLLLALLDRYPLIPAAYQRLSKAASSSDSESNQRLLDEALTEQRQENRQQLRKLLKDRRRFRDTETGCRIILSGTDVERLLQVLNDIRVGSWIKLGSPEDDLWDFNLNETTAPHAWAMEMAGYFEAQLLEALQERHST